MQKILLRIHRKYTKADAEHTEKAERYSAARASVCLSKSEWWKGGHWLFETSHRNAHKGTSSEIASDLIIHLRKGLALHLLYCNPFGLAIVNKR